MKWFDKFLNTYKSGISHEFLLYFNINDVVDETRSLDKYLYDEFIKVRNFGIIAFYDMSRGLTFLEPAMEREFHKITSNMAVDLLRANPSKLFSYIDSALRGTKMFLFVNHIEKLIPEGDISSLSYEERIALIWLCEWSINSKISSNGSAIVLLSNNISDVNRELFKYSYKIEPIIVELPTQEERKSYLEFLLKDKPVECLLTADEFSKLSSGLSKNVIKDIKLKAEAEGVPITFEFIKDKKHSLLKKEYGDVLEFIYPEIGFEDIGGMEIVKEYLLNNVVKPLREQDIRMVPMGILLCGPSGTGKTLLVNALAKTSGFNCVKLDMSRILGQYVGESEKNFKKCLLGAKSQEPVIIFVDEIDTAFRRGDSGDSGVGRNIFSEFLQFTSDSNNRGKIVFVAATNRPDLLDAALKRAGRFDKKIPILLPEAKERTAILKIKLKKIGLEMEIEDFNIFEQNSEGFTGAEIELVARKVLELLYNENKIDVKVTNEHITKAMQKCIPSTKDIQLMTRLAVLECDDIDLIPEKYRHFLEEIKI